MNKGNYAICAALAFGMALVTGCSTSTEEKPSQQEKAMVFGQPVSEKGALSAAELPKMLSGKDTVHALIAGKVLEVCKQKGCWMNVEVPGQLPMRVSFKDYGFFLPAQVKGKLVVFEGVAFHDTVSVEDQRHFAEDAGKSEAEIATITQPKPVISFVASGVTVKKVVHPK